MGNKPASRRKQSTAEDVGHGDAVVENSGTMKRSKSSESNSRSSGKATVTPSERDKTMISCPNLSSGTLPHRGAAGNGKLVANGDGVSPPPGGAGGGPRQMEIKIYRSYTNVAEASRRPEARPDIRVYRRNTFGRRTPLDAAERSQTLPRGFGRQRANTNVDSLEDSDATPPSGIAGDMATLPRAPSSHRRSAAELKRQSVPGLYGSGLGESRTGCRRSNSTTSMASVGYRVAASDFPDTQTIKRRLAQFEAVFVRCLTRLFSGLPESDQLSALSVAVRTDGANQHVSLRQYLTSADIPLDLPSAASVADEDGFAGPRFLLTLQPALFSGLMHVRKDCPGDQAAALSVAGELLTCLAAESAAELGRIFEYQICLLSDGLAIELLASQAAHCVLDYVCRTGRLLDRNAIVLGAVRGQHVIASGVSPKLSVIIGQRELKWEIHEILKKPGLRRELFLFDSTIEVDQDNPPWVFRTSVRHDPMLYGYRGLIVEWDYLGLTTVSDSSNSSTATTTTAVTTGAIYRLNGEDEASFTDEMDWRPDDFHRTYCPYRRLIGSGVMHQFAEATSRRSAGSNGGVVNRATATLAEYVRRLQGEQYSRDQIQPVCRPIISMVSGLSPNSAGSTEDKKQLADDVFVLSGNTAGAGKFAAGTNALVQRPLAVSVANQSTTAADDDDRFPVVVVVTPTLPSAKTPSESKGKTNVEVGKQCQPANALMPKQSTERSTSSTATSDDSEGFVEAPEATADWSPSTNKETTAANRETTVVTETRVISHNNVQPVRESETSGRFNGHDGDTTATVTRYVTTVERNIVRNGWPARDSNGMVFGSDDCSNDVDLQNARRRYVIDETTRKTIRSDI